MLPQMFHEEELDDRILEKLNIWAAKPQLERWTDLVERLTKPAHVIDVGVVGKYVHLADTYKSLNESLTHGGVANDCRVEITYIDSETLSVSAPGSDLDGLDAILVPGGFGDRGIEGKIAAVRYAREQGVPFFGICLGLQVATIEFARNVMGLAEANSHEFSEHTAHKVIHLMDDQDEITDKGGTMRLGAYPCQLSEGSRAHEIYGSTTISERHRHRFEVNPAYHQALTDAGLVLSGLSPDGKLVEMIELPDHPYYVACQFHPEFKSRPLDPHPLFVAFVKAGLARRRGLEDGMRSGSTNQTVAGGPH
jgi:CTP synthase